MYVYYICTCARSATTSSTCSPHLGCSHMCCDYNSRFKKVEVSRYECTSNPFEKAMPSNIESSASKEIVSLLVFFSVLLDCGRLTQHYPNIWKSRLPENQCPYDFTFSRNAKTTRSRKSIGYTNPHFRKTENPKNCIWSLPETVLSERQRNWQTPFAGHLHFM